MAPDGNRSGLQTSVTDTNLTPCAAQLSNYNPTCNSVSPKSLSCPDGAQFASDQYSWLAANLASYSRTNTPCVFTPNPDPKTLT